MLFDIFNYNVSIAIAAFILFFALFAVLFKKYTTTLADPLFFHILWLSSQAAFLIIYFVKYNPDVYFYVFATTLATYILSLFLFFRVYESSKYSKTARLVGYRIDHFFTKKILFRLLLISTSLVAFSYANFFQYAISCTSVSDLFLYRFIDLQGRDPMQRIASAASPILLMAIFYSIHANIYRKFSAVILLLFVLVAMFAGGRSILILTLAAFGMYAFYFNDFMPRSLIKKLNRYIGVFFLFAILIAIFVTSFFDSESSIESATVVIFNRVFAAPDGVEYYLKYSGAEELANGLLPYLQSIFGVYIKNIFGTDVKNIGWQLTELAIGNVDFAQGSNYTVLLQAMVFNIYLAPIYAIPVAWVVAKLRYSFSQKQRHTPLVYSLSSLSFVIATDIEYFMFLAISLILMYCIIYVPIIQMRLK